MIDLSVIDGRVTDKESVVLEFKSALKGIPNSTWETYSSFANTFGGTIVLGIQDGTGIIEGVPHTEQRIQEIWNILNNPQIISRNILRSDDIETLDYDGKQLIAINVPRADRFTRPVYYKNMESGTFKRNGEGDYHCTMPEIASLLRDQSESSYDSSILDNTSFEDIDKETLQAYRNELRVTQPDHMWNRCDDADFLRKIDAIGHSTEQLTVAGLLMFGKEEVISSYYPRFKLDYMECPIKNTSWNYRRVTGDGLWVGNIYNFFSLVRSRIGADLEQPLTLDDDMHRVMDTDIHKAVREGLINCLMHADYLGNLIVKIEKYRTRIVMVNSGLFRIPLEIAERGGESDPRNTVIAKMFSLIGLSERAGVGINFIIETWKERFGYIPAISEDVSTQRTTVEYRFGPKRGSQIDMNIMDAIRDDPNITLDGIASRLGLSRPTIANHIKSLKSSGSIDRIGGTRGHWVCK